MLLYKRDSEKQKYNIRKELIFDFPSYTNFGKKAKSVLKVRGGRMEMEGEKGSLVADGSTVIRSFFGFPANSWPIPVTF